MVAGTRRRLGDRRGITRLGCLFSLLLLATGVYYGVALGGVYMSYYRVQDEMRTQAKVAPSVDDATIRRRILRKIDQLALPAEARRELQVQRTLRPREIRIHTTYQDTLVLPFYKYVVTLKPEARQPL
jgi:hypothetical protein